MKKLFFFLIIILLIFPIVYGNQFIVKSNSGFERTNNFFKSSYIDKRVHAMTFESSVVINANPARVYNNNTLDGNGESICVIDTGVWSEHPAINGSVIAQKCFCFPDCCPNGLAEDNNASDNNGHGTHVSGIIVSKNQSYPGIAPNASIVAVKVLDDNGDGYESDVISGIEWCVNNSFVYNISVISLSLGEGSYATGCEASDYLAEASENASSQGIVVVASSGNEASVLGTSTPSCATNVISVGSSYDANVGGRSWASCTDLITAKDMISCFTNIGTIKPEIIAPGAMITSSVPPLAYCPSGGHCSDDLKATMGGTSMAVPHISAAAVIAIQMFKLTRNSTPSVSDIREAIVNSDVILNKSGSFIPRIDFDSMILTFENESPVIEMISSNETFQRIFNITALANDIYSEIDKCKLEFLAVNYSMDIIRNNNSAICSFIINLSLGNNSFKVYANDSRNNLGFFESNVTLYNNAPQIDFATPGNISANSSVLLNISATDLDNDSLSYNWSVNGSVFIGNSTYNLSGFSDSVIIFVEVFDGYDYAFHSWNITFLPLNYAPVWTIIPNNWAYPINISSPSNITINLSEYVSDDSPIEFFLPDISDLNLSLNGSILFINSNTTGYWNISINASDGNLSSISEDFEIWIIVDSDEDNHNITPIGDDCNDDSAIIFPGHSCSLSGYKDTTYNEECVCSGGTRIVSSSSGGSSGTISIPLNVHKKYFSIIPENIPVLGKVYQKKIPVERYYINSKIMKTKVDITITSLFNYSFKVKLEGLNDDEIQFVDLILRVNSSWAKNYDQIVLNRFEGGKWKEYLTKYVEEKGNLSYYSVRVPGFSNFNILGKITPKKVMSQTVIQNISENITNTENITKNIKDKTLETNLINSNENITQKRTIESPTKVKESEKLSFVPIFIIISLITFLGIIFVVFSPKKEEHHPVEDYIEKRLILGHREEHIHMDLKERGWHPEKINYYTQKVKKRLEKK